MPDTQISDALGLIDGGLQLLLAAVHADDPKREMLVRVGDLLRDVRSLQAALSGHIVGWRTMDSAPKDGSNMLAYGEQYGITLAYWGNWFDNLLEKECEGWIELESYNKLSKVTHWQPLPAPPVPEMEG